MKQQIASSMTVNYENLTTKKLLMLLERKGYDLTPKQAFGLGVIRAIIKRGYSPTISELANYIDITRQAAEQLVVVLERKGYVARDRGAVRSLRLTSKPLPYATQKKAA